MSAASANPQQDSNPSLPGAATGTTSRRSKRFDRWLEARIPPSASITLSQRNIFIFPTRTGFAFSGLLLLLILGAINYQASLVYGMAFLLGSLFLITILYTFRNLSGLTFELVSHRPAFVGENLEFSVRVVRPKQHPREGIQLGWPAGDKQWAELFETSTDVARMYVPAERRGLHNPGRLLVETFFPLGLLRAWTWIDLDARGLTYPKPIFDEYPAQGSGNRTDGSLIDPAGSEDFTDLRVYQPGDPLKHVLWRSYAKSDELMVKNYASYVEPRLWFDLETLPGGLEERLSRMAGLALKAVREDREFGARIGPRIISPAKGQQHLDQVLRELGLYGVH